MERLVEHVIVPVDGSSFSARALTVAAHFAEVWDAQLEVVTVIPEESRRAAADARLHDVIGELGGGGHLAATVLVGRDAAIALAAHGTTRANPLFCLASHGRARLAAVLGSVAAGLVSSASHGLVVVGPHAGDRPEAGPVVASLDGSDGSAAVAPLALAWAARLGTSLELVTVSEHTAGLAFDGRYHRFYGPPEPDAYLRSVAASLPPVAGVTVTTTSLAHPVGPAPGLAYYLRHHPARLVVVATHARRGLRRMLVGSESAHIVGRVPIPVLLAPLATQASSAQPGAPELPVGRPPPSVPCG